jgi:hypothetical protein
MNSGIGFHHQLVRLAAVNADDGLALARAPPGKINLGRAEQDEMDLLCSRELSAVSPTPGSASNGHANQPRQLDLSNRLSSFGGSRLHQPLQFF